MITPGQTLENPVTGERFTFTATAASTGGELLAFELGLRPGGAVPMPHVHPIQTERFEVVSGRMRFRVGLRTIVAEPGEVVEVAPGVMHSFANAGDQDVRVLVEVRPALRMEEMFADVIAMAEAGRMNRRGLPRSLLDLVRLARAYDQEAHAPLLGVGVQRTLLAPLVALANRRAAAGRAANRTFSGRHASEGHVRPHRGRGAGRRRLDGQAAGAAGA
jgi:quercetin dioxygenase-like cupin family protein